MSTACSEKMITQIKSDYTDKRQHHDPLTEQIIGSCFKVHRELGPGFPEKIYQAALEVSLQETALAFTRQERFPVSCDGSIIGSFALDLVVEKQAVVEVKAVVGIMPKVFESQVLAYLKAAKLPVGLLVNFGNPSCQVKRLVL